MKLSSRLSLPLLAACLCSGAAQAATAPPTGVVFDLTGVTANLVSTLDGSVLPVQRTQTSWSLGTKVQSGVRTDEHYASQDYADYSTGLPVRVGALLDSGYGTVSIPRLYGDIHAAAGFTNYVLEAHEAYATTNMAAYFIVPGHARLTLSGHVTVSSAGDPDVDYVNFSSLFAAQGLVSDSFALEKASGADQDFTITATNPYDGPSWFYQVTSVNLFSFVQASPVPEAPVPAMLAAGLLLIAWKRIRSSAT